jgi:folate-binding protein YgfZ
MHDNPAAAQASVFALPQHRVVALSGRDAVAFAHAQFMNDVAALAPGRWQWNGWLTPKGRVVALFALLRIDDETLWLLLADDDAGDFVARLRRFVFRSKVAIDVRDDLLVSAAFDTPRVARDTNFARLDEGRIELDFGGDGGARVAWIAQRMQVDGADDADAVLRWARADLAHGLPRLIPAQAEQWTPQQLSLERLRAYSVKKGCYPGQEIVARTHFLGQAKRGLVLLESKRVLPPGSDVEQCGRSIGTIVSSSAIESATERDGGRDPRPPALALAVLPLERDDAPMQANGQELSSLALRDGLAR